MEIASTSHANPVGFRTTNAIGRGHDLGSLHLLVKGPCVLVGISLSKRVKCIDLKRSVQSYRG